MMGLTAGVVMLFSAVQPVSSAEAAVLPAAPVGVMATTTASVAPEMEQVVRAYFADTPVLAEVARCESTFVQFEKNGKIRRGKVNKDDIGIMQINEYYHGDTAKKRGDDLYTLEGNMDYAKYLFAKNGLSDWDASKPCWSKTLAYREYVKQVALGN